MKFHVILLAVMHVQRRLFWAVSKISLFLNNSLLSTLSEKSKDGVKPKKGVNGSVVRFAICVFHLQ